MKKGAITCPAHSHVRQPVRGLGRRECANLSLSKDRQEDIRGVISGGPRSNEQQRVHGIKGRRFDEHRDDGPVQSTNFRLSHGTANIPAMQDKPRDNHEGEEDVERNRDRKVWKTKVDDGTVPDTATWL